MKGKISITRSSGGNTDGMIHITVTDSSSNRKAIDILLNPATLTEALTGCARMDVTYELSNLDLLGKRKESKNVFIAEVGKEPRLKKKDVEAGWIYNGGYKNHHHSANKDGASGFNCTLIRFVDIDPDEPEIFEAEE